MRSTIAGRFSILLALALTGWGCGVSNDAEVARSLTGEWDYFRMLGAAPNGGFEARRRFGFAHFEGADAESAWLHRRAGGDLEVVTNLTLAGDSLTVDFASGSSLVAELRGDTIAGVLMRGGVPADRVWLVRRDDPPQYEPNFPLWSGPVSDSTFAVTIDPAVPMPTRDGTVLMNFVGRPVGDGPFGVVMERTPYLRGDSANAIFWASRGYIYVKQDVRGRGGSQGVLDMNAMQEQDGYDAVEWAAALPGSNGKVGMIGRSNPGLYTWYAAISQPPHLTTIAPVVATADPLRLVPYIDMAFSPTIVPWLCLTAVRETLSDISNVNLVPAFNHLPVIESAERAGCPRPQFWDDWFDHQQEDSYWRALSIERRLDRVQVPVLGIAGWYDDARGTIRNYEGMEALPSAPLRRIVMDPGSHKGIDYVNGDFGPQARLDHRQLQLRWFDHWLKGMENGVESEPPLDLFIMGDNAWRQENEWPLARTRFTNFYLHSGGAANSTSGDGTLDTLPPGSEPSDAYTYDPGDPTPYLVDARELELNINEDYSEVHGAREDVLVYTTEPLRQDTEVTGPMTATLWAATDARDTDWNIMILQVRPDGSAWRVQDGLMRARFREGFDSPSLLTSDRVYRYDIDLWFTALVIPAGDRIRVVVSSAAFPKYDRNLNTGGDNERDTVYVAARQRVLHDTEHPSHVTLPLIPRGGGLLPSGG
jgi:uncharacterized protein